MYSPPAPWLRVNTSLDMDFLLVMRRRGPRKEAWLLWSSAELASLVSGCLLYLVCVGMVCINVRCCEFLIYGLWSHDLLTVVTWLIDCGHMTTHGLCSHVPHVMSCIYTFCALQLLCSTWVPLMCSRRATNQPHSSVRPQELQLLR